MDRAQRLDHSRTIRVWKGDRSALPVARNQPPALTIVHGKGLSLAERDFASTVRPPR